MTALGLALLIFAGLSISKGCVFLHGDSPLVQELTGEPFGHWGYEFQGENWAGFDAFGKEWLCGMGSSQAPINIPTATSTSPRVAQDANSLFTFGSFKSNGSNLVVLNNGHTIQVEFRSEHMPMAQIKVPEYATQLLDALHLQDHQHYRLINATAIQLHFHSHSEHFLDGAPAILELHIVHIVKPDQLSGCTPENGYVLGGCIAVLGVMFKLDETRNPALDTIWKYMPLYEQPEPGWNVSLPSGTVLDLDGLLPGNRSYATYAGSLTTPPCYEGLLWHVMTHPITISLDQYKAFLVAVGDWDCADKRNSEQLPEEDVLFVEAGYDKTAFIKMWEEQHRGGHVTQRVHRPHRHRLPSHIARPNPRQDAVATFDPASAHQDSENYTCVKVGLGANFRYTQPLNGRTPMYWTDEGRRPSKELDDESRNVAV